MRAARILAISLLSFLAVEYLVFHTGLYPSMVKPDSTAGLVQSILSIEMAREVHDRNQIAIVGDSRMGFFAQTADKMKDELGYTFRSIGVAGSSPRIWYYLLRKADPTARRYSAVVIPVDNYDDAEIPEVYADRTVDLNYLIGVLGWRDLLEFSNSYRKPELKIEMMRGLLFKGLVFKRDFDDLLEAPGKRWYEVHFYGPNAWTWRYEYKGEPGTLTGVQMDWKTRTMTGPPEVIAAHGLGLRLRFLDPWPPSQGIESEYLQYWLGKICDYYKDSGTRIVFIRLPRGGFVRPDQPAVNPVSSVRLLSQRPGVILAPEHQFDDLERPELFRDEVHLNGEGEERFTVEMAREVKQLLGSK